jgi:hypothetical protein
MVTDVSEERTTSIFRIEGVVAYFFKAKIMEPEKLPLLSRQDFIKLRCLCLEARVLPMNVAMR